MKPLNKPCVKCGSINRNTGGDCKACKKQWRLDNSESIKQYRIDNAEYFKQWREDNPENYNQWKINNLDKVNRHNEKYRQNNTQKIKARNAINHAVTRGDVPYVKTLMCSRCDNQATEYHHWSYKTEYRLDVEPLCTGCHRSIDHKELNYES